MLAPHVYTLNTFIFQIEKHPANAGFLNCLKQKTYIFDFEAKIKESKPIIGHKHN